MLDLNEVRTSFPELTNITPLNNISGQRLVFSAEQSGKKVALKVFKGIDQDKVDRLLREAEAVQRLRSPCVPTIFSHGTKSVNGTDHLFLIEQWIDGQTFDDVLKISPRPELQEVLTYGNLLFRECVGFESQRLVHRDIKPGNLKRAPDGSLWILDFGIVRVLDLASITATEATLGCGTFGYAAPEQYRNIKVEIDSRADIFSIGIFLYEMLNGGNPHIVGARDILEVIRRVESADLPRLKIAGDVDGQLSEFLASVCSRFPSRRPQTAAEAFAWWDPIYKSLRAP